MRGIGRAFAGIIVALFASSCVTADAAKARGARPNVLVIIVDDLGFGDVGFNGSEIRTPSLDALAARGTVLSKYYTYPVCSTTRAALLTGQSSIRLGVDGPIGDEHVMPRTAPLLPEILKQNGYQTLMVGKWHLGAVSTEDLPHRRGFDYYYGHLGGYIDFFTHLRDGGLDWQRNGSSLREAGYSTDLLAEDAARVIVGRDRQRPFFLYLAFNAPHTPLQVPAASLAGYESIKDPVRRQFAGMVTAMDAAIGRVMDTLRSEGVLDDTIVVFVSDNGGNERAGADNGPLRAGKGTIFEGGMRVPALVSWPEGLSRRGARLESIMTVHDWVPTLLSAIDVDVRLSPTVIGHDMWSTISSGRPPRVVPQRVMGIGLSTAVYEGRWKLVNIVPKNGNAPQTLLFDIVADPGEQRDLAGENREVVDRLMKVVAATPRGKSLTSPSSRPPEERWTKNGVISIEYSEKEETREPWAEAIARGDKGSANPPEGRK